VIGVMARKIQLSNYFSSDDESVVDSLLLGWRFVEYALRGGDAV